MKFAVAVIFVALVGTLQARDVKWLSNGVRLGQRSTEVQKKMGEPESIGHHKKPADFDLYYRMSPPQLILKLEFRNDELKRIREIYDKSAYQTTQSALQASQVSAPCFPGARCSGAESPGAPQPAFGDLPPPSAHETSQAAQSATIGRPSKAQQIVGAALNTAQMVLLVSTCPKLYQKPILYMTAGDLQALAACNANGFMLFGMYFYTGPR